MTPSHRIAATAVILSLAAAGAPAATAHPADDPATPVHRAPAAVYSRPDREMIPVSPPPASSGNIGRTAALRSAAQQERQRVAALSAYREGQIAAALDVAASAAHKASASQAVVRVQVPHSGFDWGDAGIGAAGAVALAMLGVGGALVISQRPRRTRPGTTGPN